ncbi:MAG: gliding motility-associated C-terminal domain-containing protein [Ekhidna sp.]
MKKFILTILFSGTLICSNAFHIVGGEMEFIYVSDGVYRINVIQYFDEAQENNPGPEGQVTVYIFRNGDDQLMSTHDLNLFTQENVSYTNVECAIDELQTSRVIWSGEISLDPSEYSNKEGYYMVWERCCRNANIKNIVNPSGAGMKYTLEFPPLMRDGEIFKNSSPILFQPLSDYACINQLYYIEFTGTDPDGDSLVYTLATPLNSSAGNVAVPTPSPKPHFGVVFGSNYSEENMIPGSSPLKISKKGLLTVSPSETGLFVFSVLVEEYRGIEKIGETRRDFQMLVVDGCLPPDPPVVNVDIPDDPGFNPFEDVLSYTVGDEEKCFDFLVANVTEGETISLRAEGVNFDEDLDEIFSFNQIPIGEGQNQLKIEICIPDCPPVRDGPFIVDLIAADDACPLPQLDTLRLMINVEPPPNDFPAPSIISKSISINEDLEYLETFSATDPDGDSLNMTLFIEGIEDPALFGFSLDTINSNAGSIEGVFKWDTSCENFDFSELQNFNVAILIDDFDECSVPNPDTLYINSTVILPPNTNPEISSDQAIPSTVVLGTMLNFNVSAEDTDGDDLSLIFVGGNFSPETYGVEFTPSSGNSLVSSVFTWDLSCNASLYEDGQEFELLFIADDDDKCKTKNFDTLRQVVKVVYPENAQPEFEQIARRQTLRVNEQASIDIEAFDLDANDDITMTFADGIRQPASASLNFQPVSGKSRIRSVLEWKPECSLLRFGETSKLLDVVLQVSDNACPISKIDTLKITFEIIDNTERQESFLPPNVFTPNGDGVNDRFQLNGNVDINQNLPPDNCDNTFLYIDINNRAGTSVFRSENRDFAWTGGQFPAGVYFYVIKYTNTEFKGYIHLMR